MSAFDWSPGGCCCKPPGGCFDIYGLVITPNGTDTPLPHPGGLVRYGVMWPEIAQTPVTVSLTNAGYRSKERIDWVIPPAVAPPNPGQQSSTATVCGRPDLGDFVWSMEQRGATLNGGGVRTLVLYDAAAKQESASFIVPNSSVTLGHSIRLTGAFPFGTSCSNNEFWSREGSTRTPPPLPSIAQQIQDHPGYTLSSGQSYGALFEKGVAEARMLYKFNKNYASYYEGGPRDGEVASYEYADGISHIGVRDWPNAMGYMIESIFEWTGVGFNYNGVYKVSFWRGRVSVSGDGEFMLPAREDRAILHSFVSKHPYFSTSSSSDPGSGAGIIQIQKFDCTADGANSHVMIAFSREDREPGDFGPSTGRPVRTYVHLYINDSLAKSYSAAIPGGGSPTWPTINGSTNFIAKCVFGWDGAGMDHQGNIFIPQSDFLAEPGSTATGTYNDSLRPIVGVMYRDGVETWRTQRIGTVSVRYASDRWFYLFGLADLGQFTTALPKAGWLPDEKYTVPTSGLAPLLWVANANGVGAPIGHLKYDTKFVIGPRQLTPQGLPSGAGGRVYDCVKNTGSLDGTLPADPDDFEAAVKDATQ